MSDLLLDVPAQNPKWKELAERHGINTGAYSDESSIAKYSEEGGFYAQVIDGTEREAVITLIHRLKLDGWRGVSL